MPRIILSLSDSIDKAVIDLANAATMEAIADHIVDATPKDAPVPPSMQFRELVKNKAREAADSGALIMKDSVFMIQRKRKLQPSRPRTTGLPDPSRATQRKMSHPAAARISRVDDVAILCDTPISGTPQDEARQIDGLQGLQRVVQHEAAVLLREEPTSADCSTPAAEKSSQSKADLLEKQVGALGQPAQTATSTTVHELDEQNENTSMSAREPHMEKANTTPTDAQELHEQQANATPTNMKELDDEEADVIAMSVQELYREKTKARLRQLKHIDMAGKLRKEQYQAQARAKELRKVRRDKQKIAEAQQLQPESAGRPFRVILRVCSYS